jgi:hypothetical protein
MSDVTIPLDPTRLQNLKELEIPILVPGRLPSDLTQIQTNIERGGQGPAFRVVFHASPQRWVAMQGSSGGVGDVMFGDAAEDFETEQAGPGRVEFYDPGSQEPVDFRSHWLQPQDRGTFYSLSGQGLTESEVLEVARSLRWL